MELTQILKFLQIIKKREIETGKIVSSEVRRECELGKIDRGLQFLIYKENEDFCYESGIIIKKKDRLIITETGEEILKNIESKGKINQIIIENCLLKSKFSNKIMPGLNQFHKNKQNEIWYEMKLVTKLFENTEIATLLHDVGLFERDTENNRIKLNSKFSQNELITKLWKISQKDLEEDLRKSEEIKKKIGLIAEKRVEEFEKKRLEEYGCIEEANNVEQISQDWANKGYDIESFDEKSNDLIPDRFIEVKGSTGKNFSIFWSQNEIEVAKKLGKKYWIYFISEIDLEKGTTPNDPEIIPNPYYRIDPLNEDPTNTEFNKNPESIHVTKKKEN